MDEEGLAIVCSTLGSFQENGTGQDVYVKHEDCIESLKDLQRYLRRDHPESRDVFMQLGKWNIVRKDIVPLIVRYGDEHELVLNCVKVLVFLTMPIDPSSHQVSLQVEYLQHIRAAVVHDETIPVIMSLLEEPLQHLERRTPRDEDWKMVQLFLTLLRNLLAIPDSYIHHISASTQFAFLRDSLLELLLTESALELVVALTQHTAGRQGGLRQDNFLFLEILHHVLSDKRPEMLLAAQNYDMKDAKKYGKSSGLLRALMEEEKALERRTRYDPASHTPFSGTFVRVAQDGTKSILTRTPHQSPLENILFKPQVKRGPIKRVLPVSNSFRPLNGSLQRLLKDFVDQFLASGYNVLMQTLKEDLRRENVNSQPVDPAAFFHVVQFFTGYQSCLARIDQKRKKSALSTDEENAELPCEENISGLIATTLDEDMFTLVRSRLSQYIEEAQISKDWSLVAAGVSVLKDMIHMIDAILKRTGLLDKEAALEQRSARILLYKVFYDQTDTGMIQTVTSLVKNFDLQKQTRSFLADLVEITHVVLRILEVATKEGTLRVLKKVRGRKKTTSQATEGEEVAGSPKTELAFLEDPEEPVAEESAGAEVTLEEGAEGKTDLSTDTLDKSDLPQQAGVLVDTDTKTASTTYNKASNHVTSTEEGSDVEPGLLTKEVSLDVQQLVVRRLADNVIVRNYCWLLNYYASNSPATNYYIAHLLQRIYKDQVLEPMLYQLSLFQTFYSILSNKQLCAARDQRFLVGFLTKVVRGFFEKLSSQPMLFVELLFWKLKQECISISADYMINSLKDSSRDCVQRELTRNIAEALGDDEDAPLPSTSDIPWAAANGDDMPISDGVDHKKSRASFERSVGTCFRDDARTTQQQEVPLASRMTDSTLENQLQPERSKHASGKVGKAIRHEPEGPTTSTAGKKRHRSNLFSESQDEELKDLFKRHCKSKKCSQTIAEQFGGLFTPVQVSRRLRTLGLVRRKSRTKLQAFLANVQEANAVSADDDISDHNRSPLSDDSDDDHAVLGSLLRGVRTSADADFSNTNVPGGTAVESSVPDLRAIIGKGSRLRGERNKSLLSEVEAVRKEGSQQCQSSHGLRHEVHVSEGDKNMSMFSVEDRQDELEPSGLLRRGFSVDEDQGEKPGPSSDLDFDSRKTAHTTEAADDRKSDDQNEGKDSEEEGVPVLRLSVHSPEQTDVDKGGVCFEEVQMPAIDLKDGERSQEKSLKRRRLAKTHRDRRLIQDEVEAHQLTYPDDSLNDY